MTQPRLSILICTLHSRAEVCKALEEKLRAQAPETDVEILVYPTKPRSQGGPTRGAKRKALLQSSTGQFIVFHDDDDQPSDDYCPAILEHCNDGIDCIGFQFNCYGYVPRQPNKLETASVSKRYKNWTTNVDGFRYVRHTHHLVPVLREHALSAGFDHKLDIGEDYAYSMSLMKSGLLKNEAYIDKALYTIMHNPHKKPGT